MGSLTDTLSFPSGLDIAARSRAGANGAAPENQDNFVVIDGNGRAVFLHGEAEHVVQLAGWPRGHVRVAVLDGMGGHGHGRQASEAAVAGLLRLPGCVTEQALNQGLDDLHKTLQQYFAGADDALKPPGTTLTLLELRHGLAPLLYHVGDSRLYEITREHARPLTIDHVPATSFALHGLLGEEEWWQQVHGEHRAQISQAFILGNAISDPQNLAGPLYPLQPDNLPPFLRRMADRRALTVRTDATYLLASDGFWACAEPAAWIARWPSLLAPTPSSRCCLHALFGDFIDTPPPGLHVDNLTAIAMRFRTASGGNIDETALPENVF